LIFNPKIHIPRFRFQDLKSMFHILKFNNPIFQISRFDHIQDLKIPFDPLIHNFGVMITRQKNNRQKCLLFFARAPRGALPPRGGSHVNHRLPACFACWQLADCTAGCVKMLATRRLHSRLRENAGNSQTAQQAA
jgi:hypothetical protein